MPDQVRGPCGRASEQATSLSLKYRVLDGGLPVRQLSSASRHALAALALFVVPATLAAQQQPTPTRRPNPRTAQPLIEHMRPAPRLDLPAPSRALDSLALAHLRWREIGPFRGGRSVAVVGSVARPNEYYMGTTGGGVFKSLDGGLSWGPVTDKYFGGTIGAVEVAPSNPDIVYVGGGEYPIRGNVAHGDGVWKTMNGGRTRGIPRLPPTRRISHARVH